MSTSFSRPPLAEEHAPRRRRLGCLLGSLLVGALLVTGVYVGVEWFRTGMDLGGQVCRATAAGTTVTFTPEQMDNAATIVGIGMGRGLPARAGTIAIATAIQESKLRNIDYGDRDSLGLFQQRPSQGWGTPEQILTPEFSTNAFYDALVRIDGYQDMVITEVAQEVQRSAFPDAYADHETEGRVIASTLAGHTAESMVCRLDAPTGHTVHDDLVVDLQSHLGLTGTIDADGRTLTVETADPQQAWSVGQYLVAKAERHAVTEVQVDDRRWVRRSGPTSLEWQSADASVGPTTVVATLTPTPTES
ncbi:hypothetical protein [Nostocoides sp. F2B08]|uniref:hypothetical protein n=1 Tax=Nostocoides sp. F2B08 TaxID=2653936 RepID=UPI00186B2E6C|nr:hypothetical protein [Tetrasphaera sp. F2B08]